MWQGASSSRHNTFGSHLHCRACRPGASNLKSSRSRAWRSGAREQLHEVSINSQVKSKCFFPGGGGVAIGFRWFSNCGVIPIVLRCFATSLAWIPHIFALGWDPHKSPTLRHRFGGKGGGQSIYVCFVHAWMMLSLSELGSSTILNAAAHVRCFIRQWIEDRRAF